MLPQNEESSIQELLTLLIEFHTLHKADSRFLNRSNMKSESFKGYQRRIEHINASDKKILYLNRQVRMRFLKNVIFISEDKFDVIKVKECCIYKYITCQITTNK